MFKRLSAFLFNPIAQDAGDNTLTSTSMPWKHQYYCSECKAKTGHEEFMTEICLSCGHKDKGNCRKNRAARKIWNGKGWIEQHKY